MPQPALKCGLDLHHMQAGSSKSHAKDAQRRSLVSAVMPDAEALAALATAYARRAQLPQALQFYTRIKRSFR